nr:MAG TPA: hypothetical protein [Caudoviricetes sp.]
MLRKNESNEIKRSYKSCFVKLIYFVRQIKYITFPK